MKKPRRKIDTALKAKIALEALREQATLAGLPDLGMQLLRRGQTLPFSAFDQVIESAGATSASTAKEIVNVIPDFQFANIVAAVAQHDISDRCCFNGSTLKAHRGLPLISVLAQFQ